MSQENVEIVRGAFEAINRGDVDAALKDAAPGFEFDFSRAFGPQHGCLGAMRCPAFLGSSTSRGGPFAERQMRASKLAST